MEKMTTREWITQIVNGGQLLALLGVCIYLGSIHNEHKSGLETVKELSHTTAQLVQWQSKTSEQIDSMRRDLDRLINRTERFPP